MPTPKHITGFETGSLDQLYSYTGGTISGSGQRTGNYSLLGADTVDPSQLDAEYEELMFRGYFYLDAAPSADATDFMRLRNVPGYNQSVVEMNADRTLTCTDGTGDTSTEQMSTGSWHLVELYKKNETGGGGNAIAVVWVDDVEWLRVTDGASSQGGDHVRLFDPSSTGGSYWDDTHLATATDETQIGAGQIEAIRPDGDGTGNWVTSPLWSKINDESDATEIDSNKDSVRQYFDLTGLSGSPSSIGAAQAWSRLHDQGGYQGVTYHGLRFNSTDYPSPDIVSEISATYSHHWFLPSTSPGVSDIAGMQAFVDAGATTKTLNCADIWVEVDYVVAAAAERSSRMLANSPRAERIIRALGR